MCRPHRPHAQIHANENLPTLVTAKIVGSAGDAGFTSVHRVCLCGRVCVFCPALIVDHDMIAIGEMNRGRKREKT